MKVLFDYQIFQLQKYGGISRYFYEMLKCANEDPSVQFDLSLQHSFNDYIKNRDISNHYSFGEQCNFRGKERIRHFFNQRNTLSKLKNYEVFHPTFFDDYYLKEIEKRDTKFVITVYDMINEKFPEYFQGNDKVPSLKKHLMSKADKILAISESTKYDIMKYCNIPESMIDVTYLASSLFEEEDVEITDLPANYILFVGKRSAYKNFERFYASIKNDLLKGDFTLVCAGGGSFTKEEIFQFEKDRVFNSIKYITISDNKVLKQVYKSAAIFVFPSLYEGFGIPVLEAMGVGCPVALANIGSFPEVAGDAGIYFDPYSVDDMRDKIIGHLKGQNKSKSKYLEQSAKFSWQKTYIETKKSYQSLFDS